MFDLFREIAQTLRCNKLRTSLTGLAVAWGIFMLIVLVGMTRGVINSFNIDANSKSTKTLNVWPGVTGEPWHGYREGRDITLHTRDLQAVERDNSDVVAGVSSTIYGGGTISTPDEYTSTNYIGVYPSGFSIWRMKLAAGRFINDIDIRECRKVMVLTEPLAQVLFPGKDAADVVGSRVDCAELGWQIVGVLDRWSRTAYVPFSTAAMLKGNDNEVGQMVVEMKSVETEADAMAVEAGVRKSLASSLEFNPDDQSAVWIWNSFSQYLKAQTGNEILNIAMWVLGILSLLSGIVGVSNIMFVSVKERTHEIGIRRAIGAKPRVILTQIILESVVITTVFGYIGIVMGTGLTEILKLAFADVDFLKDPGVDLSLAIEVTVVLILAGALAGLFPALKALKVKPVEALRDE